MIGIIAICSIGYLVLRKLLYSYTIEIKVSIVNKDEFSQKDKEITEIIVEPSDGNVLAKRSDRKMGKINKQEVYDYLQMIPKGCVVTYGMIADFLGDKRWARTVGNILHENPDGEKYPCYKVVSSKGELSFGYSFGGIEKQKELLEKAGIEVNDLK